MMVLKPRWLFVSARLNPFQPLNSREVDNERMESASSSLVGHSGQVQCGQLLDVIRIYGTLLSLGLSLFRSRRLIQGGSPHEPHLVVTEQVALASSDLRVNCRRAERAVPEQKRPDEFSAADDS